jgi:hypothetical protein
LRRSGQTLHSNPPKIPLFQLLREKIHGQINNEFGIADQRNLHANQGAKNNKNAERRRGSSSPWRGMRGMD